MKKFIITITIFFTITIFGIIGILSLPPTPSFLDNMLIKTTEKDSLIAETPEKRIIFIGGSNLSFGLDSQMMKDSLNLNPINMGMHAGLGLKYMLEEAQPYIKENDVVVIIPEYHQFYGDQVYGEEVLGQVALNINKSLLKDFNFNQWMMLIKNIPIFIEEKVSYQSYVDPKSYNQKNYYSKETFNKYGDATKHWNVHVPRAPDVMKLTGKYNPQAMEYIRSFINTIPSETRVFISFPGFQNQSFASSEEEIDKIYKVLVDSKIKLLGSPSRYEFDNSYFFNTSYHLNKEGTQLRTRLLIEDLKENKVGDR